MDNMNFDKIDGYLDDNEVKSNQFDLLPNIQQYAYQQRQFLIQQDHIMEQEGSHNYSQNQKSIYDSDSNTQSLKLQNKKTKPIKKKKKQEEVIESNIRFSSNQNNESNSNDKIQAKVKKGRPTKEKKVKPKNRKKKGQIDQNLQQSNAQAQESQKDFKQLYSECQEPRACFITFFFQIGHKKGLVFNQTQRIELISGQNKIKERVIEWKSGHQWKLKQEKVKIKSALEKIKILIIYESKQKLQNYKKDWQIDHNNVKKYIQDTLKETSFIFADQVTGELYKIMVNIFNIVYEHNEESQKEIRQKKLQQYGYMVLICKNLNQYIFFNFQFSQKKQFQLQEDIQVDIREKNLNVDDKDIAKENARTLTKQFNKKRKETGFFAYTKKIESYENLMKFVGQKIHKALNNKIINKKIFDKS